jgi:hypothetical protein
MGVLTLKCRTTEKMFSTGIRVDEDTFQTLPDIAVRSRCPHCGLVHVWWPHEAILADVEPFSEAPEKHKGQSGPHWN